MVKGLRTSSKDEIFIGKIKTTKHHIPKKHFHINYDNKNIQNGHLKKDQYQNNLTVKYSHRKHKKIKIPEILARN